MSKHDTFCKILVIGMYAEHFEKKGYSTESLLKMLHGSKEDKELAEDIYSNIVTTDLPELNLTEHQTVKEFIDRLGPVEFYQKEHIIEKD